MRYGIVAWTITAPENRSRLVAALAAAGVQTLLFWLLLSGLTVHFPQVVERSMAVFGVAPPPPPPLWALWRAGSLWRLPRWSVS